MSSEKDGRWSSGVPSPGREGRWSSVSPHLGGMVEVVVCLVRRMQ